jgi:hypothetical protein
MKGYREKCIEVGASSDYIARPIKSEQMLSLLRVWLLNNVWAIVLNDNQN